LIKRKILICKQYNQFFLNAQRYKNFFKTFIL